MRPEKSLQEMQDEISRNLKWSVRFLWLAVILQIAALVITIIKAHHAHP